MLYKNRVMCLKVGVVDREGEGALLDQEDMTKEFACGPRAPDCPESYRKGGSGCKKQGKVSELGRIQCILKEQRRNQ